MSELLVRILFAAVAIPVTLLAVKAGGQIFRAFCTLVLLGGGFELWRMSRVRGTPLFLPAALLGIAAFCLRHATALGDYEAWAVPLLFAVMFLLVLREVRKGDIENVFARSGATLLAVFYVGFLGSYLISISELSLPFEKLITLFFSVWASDTLAFFAGKYFGKRPLAPLISPKKTVEGLLGAVAGGIVGLLVGRSLFANPASSLGVSLIIGGAMGLFGQAGDLFESLLKRSCGVKDSSNILPGHGGILDRIDALIFTAPIYYYLIRYLA